MKHLENIQQHRGNNNMNITAETFDSLTWEQVTTKQLQQYMGGAAIMEVQPLYDDDGALCGGVNLTVKSAAGDLFIVSIEADTDNFMSLREVIKSHKSRRQHRQFIELDARREPKRDSIYIRLARVPQDNARAAQIDQSRSRL